MRSETSLIVDATYKAIVALELARVGLAATVGEFDVVLESRVLADAKTAAETLEEAVTMLLRNENHPVEEPAMAG